MSSRSTSATALRVESLEARDVPAVVLNGTFANGTTTATGGAVTVAELAGGSYSVFDQSQTNLTLGVNVNGTANDNLTLSVTNGTLSLTDSDGIYIRDQNGNLVSVGNSLNVQNVTGLAVNLDQGGDDTVTLNGTGTLNVTVGAGPGNDTITDNSTFTAALNGGAGNDTIRAVGGPINPVLLQFLQQGQSALKNPNIFPFLMSLGGQKTVNGGAGDDNITGPLVGFFNSLSGGEGNDFIMGGIGLDIIDGGPGFDVLFGLGGGDIYLATDNGPDFILNQKNDIVVADAFDFLQTPLRGLGQGRDR